MLRFVFGLPGQFTGWCDRIAAALVGSAGGSGRLLYANSLEDLALSAIASSVSDAAVASRHPGGRLRAAVTGSGRNFIVAVEDPRTAFADLAFGQEAELAETVQQVASGCAVLDGLAAAPGALAVYRESDWPRPAETAAAIARHLQIAIDQPALHDLLAGVAEANPPARPYDAVACWEELDAAQQALAHGALAPFVDGRGQNENWSIAWGPELFFLGDRPHERITGAIDITGRARCLLQGPDIMVPAGVWLLSLTATFSHGAAEHEFYVELAADRPLAGGTIRPEREGIAAVTLGFAIDDAIEQPLALRLSSRRAAFDGAIALVGATLVPAPTA
jgi:hypothetical protein